MITLQFLGIALLAHGLKPLFKQRAQQIDGSAAGVLCALIYLLLSVAALITPLLALATAIVEWSNL